MSNGKSGTQLVLSTGFSSQCFPVRSLTKFKGQDDDGGAWLVAYRAEQRRRFKAVICAGDPNASSKSLIKTFKREESRTTEEDLKPRKLDGFYLMKKFHVEDPSDLCSIRISGQELREVNEKDFLLFDNVIHVDAGDNNLPFPAFSKFSALKELELPLNNIHDTIQIQPDMFKNLETLDLSYNRLTDEDILALGLLTNLRTLHLTGNEIKKLPVEMTRMYRKITGMTLSGTVESQEQRLRFPALENLYLDHNEFNHTYLFFAFFSFNRLKYLNLEHNEISSIPHLRLLGARVRQEEISKQENQTPSRDNNSLSNVNEIEAEVEGIPVNKKQGETVEETRNESILDEVDEILDQKLAGDEERSTGFKDETHIKLQSSALLEDHSLLGNDISYNSPTHKKSDFRKGFIFHAVSIANFSFFLTNRQKPPKRPKPIINLASTPRKVNDTLPPMPKKQNMAMLEGPPLQKPTASMAPHYKTLPPIGSAPPIGRQPVFTTPRKLATAPGMAETILRETEQTRYSRTRSTPPGIPEYGSGPSTRQTVKTEGEVTLGESIGTTIGRGQPRAEGQVNTEDGFFMTQLDDQDEGQEGEVSKHLPKRGKEKERPFSVETKYKGYEDLLDVDEHDPNIFIPSDVQGSVRALKYALAHPLVFSEPQGTYKERRIEKTKVRPFGPSSRQSKMEALGGILDKMRVQSKTKESNLETTLQDLKKDPRHRREYREAKKLLREVSMFPVLTSQSQSPIT
ncbi:PREDICTED: X-ray radiation resistance-associated protein 1-like [Acropora digitifera]|uniref:X-ray radiation resistance-associated protein 1-like n=1 Tax=Acropora digitifera TaxID=70779 RepID=UPI00077A2693|nr:PREDICTED: X-ray radiation resistance-associated protein 1-like [Acropora digitifera]